MDNEGTRKNAQDPSEELKTTPDRERPVETETKQETDTYRIRDWASF